MKKLIIILFTFLSLAGMANVRTDVVNNYTSYIGVREATGQNDGREVAMFLQSVGMEPGYAWCAAFVNHCLEKAGVKTVKSAWSPSWFPEGKVIWSAQVRKMIPQPGDVFGIYFAKKKRIAHVGFIHQWTNGSGCVTVEGNTNLEGSREGDGVYKKWRLKAQIHSISNWID